MVVFVSNDRLAAEVERLSDGRRLNPTDQVAVEAFAGLSLRIRDARGELEAVGLLSGEGEQHPAVDIERKASLELRGWVKDRPDLFGRQGSPASSGREKFQGTLRAV